MIFKIHTSIHTLLLKKVKEGYIVSEKPRNISVNPGKLQLFVPERTSNF